MRFRRCLRGIGLIAASFMAAALSAQENPPLRIGVIQSLTGAASEDGTNALQALRMARDDLRGRRQIDVELLVQDDGSSSKGAVSAFQHLSLAEVHAVIGPTWDFTINSVIPLARERKIPLLVSTVFPEALTLEPAGGITLTNTLSIESEAATFDEFLKSTSAHSLAIVYAGNAWGEVQRDVYREHALRAGVTVRNESRVEGVDNNDLTPLVLKLKTQKPDVVLMLLNRSDIDMFTRKAWELRFKAAMFASKNAYDSFRLAENSREHLEGLCFPYSNTLLGGGEFVDSYKARWNSPPRIYADSAYDALFIVAEALCTRASTGKYSCGKPKLPSYSAPIGKYELRNGRYVPEGKSGGYCVRGGALSSLDHHS